jgi:hypothetical protein
MVAHRHAHHQPIAEHEPVSFSHLECVGAHNNQVDLVLRAMRNEREVGCLNVCEYRGDLHLHYIEVADGERRTGVASQLLIQLRTERDNGWLRTNGLTEDGAAFMAGIGLYRGDPELTIRPLDQVHPALKKDAFREMVRCADANPALDGLEVWQQPHPTADGELWGTAKGSPERMASYLRWWLGDDATTKYPRYRHLMAAVVTPDYVRCAFKNTAPDQP